MPRDDRMGWIRNLEAFEGGHLHHTVEYELGSECQIPGLLDYDDGKIICAAMGTEKSLEGLWLYNLAIQLPDRLRSDPLRADKKGYYFKDGIAGELLALMSLFFRCRIYLLSSRWLPNNPRMGLTQKKEYPFLRVECNPAIHPPLFKRSSSDFVTGLKDFLSLVKRLNNNLHQDFILACHHYARAVREVGVDPEMVFIRLVSAIEVLSKHITLDSKDDFLQEKNIDNLITQSTLPPDAKEELQKVFNVRKSRLRFTRFIEKHSKGFFQGGNFKAKHLKITRTNLDKTLKAIYEARSAYLHAGESMYLSRPFKGGEKWDTDPTVGMIADNRKFDEKLKLPNAFFFEGLVRHCLLNYLRNNSTS